MNPFKELFTPLDKKYCIYFYYLSVISYFLFIFIIIGLVFKIFFHSKKTDSYIFINSISMLISTFLTYFVNRLMYSMCVKSL